MRTMGKLEVFLITDCRRVSEYKASPAGSISEEFHISPVQVGLRKAGYACLSPSFEYCSIAESPRLRLLSSNRNRNAVRKIVFARY